MVSFIFLRYPCKEIFPLKNSDDFLIDYHMEEWNKIKMGVKMSLFQTIRSFIKKVFRK